MFNDEHGYFDIQRYCIEGNWMYRLLSSYTRGFNLYAGAGAFAGMTRYGIEQPVPDRYTEKKGSDYLSDQKKSDSTGGIPDKEPCFGVNASIEAEVFITRSIAATAECTIPWTSNSSLKKYFDTELVKPLLSVGLRYDF